MQGWSPTDRVVDAPVYQGYRLGKEGNRTVDALCRAS